jgi:AcrR family transcriptional regulator
MNPPVSNVVAPAGAAAYVNVCSFIEYKRLFGYNGKCNMPRSKVVPDAEVLRIAHRLIHDKGPEALTFESLARACGLSAATLVQRFGSKVRLKRSALLQAWDDLDARTAKLAADLPMTPAGSIALLVSLSRFYGGIDEYAQGLMVLREDLRDPELRARGAAWKLALSEALEARLMTIPDLPRGIGLMMAAQWQGALLWWSFAPVGPVEKHVEAALKSFVTMLTGLAAARGKQASSGAARPIQSHGSESDA